MKELNGVSTDTVVEKNGGVIVKKKSEMGNGKFFFCSFFVAFTRRIYDPDKLISLLFLGVVTEGCPITNWKQFIIVYFAVEITFMSIYVYNSINSFVLSIFIFNIK